MRRAALPARVIKEIRALLPTWLASALAVGASTVIGDIRMGMLAYSVGSVALGAQSIGQEYTHRTLALLLSQPTDRRWLFQIKMGVLAAMVVTLAALAWIILPSDARFVRVSIGHEPGILFLAAVCALFVAPWLSMLCRNPLPGTIFAIAAPLLLLIVGDLLGIAKFGMEGGVNIDRFKLAFFWPALFVVCVTGAVSSWRLFMRLEAVEPRAAHMQMPGWLSRRARSAADVLRAGAPRRHHPVWLLAKKELRLQQMTSVVVGLYLFVGAAFSLIAHMAPEVHVVPITAITIPCAYLLSVLIGSLASAEERHFGTLEWQVLLPIAMWKQWAVKTGIALGVAIPLGLGLPFLFSLADPSNGLRFTTRNSLEMTALIALLTTSGLYVSTVSTSGVRAMVVSVPAVLGGFVLLRIGLALGNPIVSRAFQAWLTRSRTLERPQAVWTVWTAALSEWLPLAVVAAFIVVLLRLGSTNHRLAERGLARLWPQAIWIAGFIVAGGVTLSLLMALRYL